MESIRLGWCALCVSILVLLGNFCNAVPLQWTDSSPPSFGDSYMTKGAIVIPYAEIREPFYAWYDLQAGSSRIDYYGGMVKTYQLSRENVYGTSLKVAPVTTETTLNEDTCLQVNGSEKMKITPQSIVPDLTGFKLVGTDMVNGLECDKWRLVDTQGDKVNKYTIWIRYKRSLQDPLEVSAIPVRYEMKGFNSLLGSHYDHYYVVYDWFSYEKPDADVFLVESNLTCVSFPGPGIDHVYLFNPMKEFVGGDDSHVDESFEAFKTKHGHKYDKNQHLERKDLFRQNARLIHSTNRANLGYTTAVNHLADRSDLELKALRGRATSIGPNGGEPFPYTEEEVRSAIAGLPASLDWRLMGAVTPVKDQSVCGSCWSFGTTGSVEGAYFLKHQKLVRLSQQALIDCSWGFGNNGCDGGEEFRAYQWIHDHGLPSEDQYGPYIGQDGYCHASSDVFTANITSYVNVTSGSADAVKLAVSKHGPIAVGIDAAHKTFSFYSNGVYYDPACGNKEENLDHAVLLVGYGELNGQAYWLIKNSWSNYWGNDGYVLIAQKDNNCGVTTDTTYVNM